jgi:hypothetical protein
MRPICRHFVHFTPHPATRPPSAGAVWGTRGPEFKSRRPDQWKAPLRRGFRRSQPLPESRPEFSPLARLRPIRMEVVRRRPEWMNRGGISPRCAGCRSGPKKNSLRFRVRSTVTRRAERDEIVERVASSVARLDDVVNGQLRGCSAVPTAVAVSHARLLAHRLPPALVEVRTVRGHVVQR